MAEGTTAIDTALETEGDADGSALIEYREGIQDPAPSGALQYIRDHEEVSARELAPPYWGKPNVAAVLLAFVQQIQTLEDTLWEMLELRTIENADLPRLKVIGKIVGQPRHGFDTEQYRTLIQARARANVSKGTARDLREVLTVLLGDASAFSMLEGGNATLYVSSLEPLTDVEVAMVEEILPDTRAAGVGLQFLWFDAGDVFVWGDPWPGTDVWASAVVM